MQIQFEREKITEHIDRIRGVGDVCEYYIHGSNRGMLVDTGYGVGDLRGYVEKEYHQPYDVVITHGHADHANGIAQWDQVYMSHLDIDLYHQRSSIALRKEMLKKRYSDIDEWPDDIFQKEYNGAFIDLTEGMTFDLGGITVETIYAPGHTQGMIVLLVREERVILFGDACGVMTFLFRPECSTVKVYQDTLRKLIGLEDRYDCILRQHGTCESPKSLARENLHLTEEILAGTDDHIPFEYLGYHAFVAKAFDLATGKRKDGVEGNIVYAADRIQ